MKKQYLNRFGYGFSALVLGLSAVNFFPAVRAYADTGYDLCSEEDVSPCFVEVTVPSSLEYTIGGEALEFSGSFNGDLIVQVDGETYTDGLTLVDAHHFALNLEFDTEGEHEIKFMVLEKIEDAKSFAVTAVADGDAAGGGVIEPGDFDYDFVGKTINVNETFTVEAVAHGSITAYDVTDEGHYLVSASSDSSEADEEDDYSDEEIGPKIASEDQITIVESAPGKYNITALKAGRYSIDIVGFYVVDGVLTQKITTVMVLAIGATTEAATTITDVINGWSEASEIVERAWAEYMEVASNPDSTEEEIQAALDAFFEKDAAAYGAAELREKNTFGEDADAIVNAVYAGKTISTKVAAESVAEADLDEKVRDALLGSLDISFSSDVKFYDISIVVYANGEEIGTLKELTGQQAVILSGFEGASAGFNRIFKVLGYHAYLDAEGNEQVEIIEIDDVEFDEETGLIIFGADKFSTYAVAYKDVLTASVNAGVFTGEGASASTSAATSVIAAIVAVALLGVFKFAKSKRS